MKKCVYCGEQNSHHRSLCPHKFKTKSAVVYTTNECTAEQEQCAQQNKSGQFTTCTSYETKQDICSQQNESALLSQYASEIKQCTQKCASFEANKTVSQDTHQTHSVRRSPNKNVLKQEMCTQQELHTQKEKFTQHEHCTNEQMCTHQEIRTQQNHICTVIMQTALSNVSNPNTNASAETRIILDLGSQRTYITENLCTKLGLKCKTATH